jgi:Rrf2 family protein
MKILTKNTDYAVRALVNLAKSGRKFVSARTIAQGEQIPIFFLRRILQELINNKVVVSKEGVDGGVKLNVQPKDIRVSQIINIFQGELQVSECLFRKKICPHRSRCILRNKLQLIEQKLVNEFNKITIAGLLKESLK